MKCSLARFGFLSSALCLFAIGCAKGPSGGVVTPVTNDRLTVTMKLQQPVNAQYYYAFAFDDDGQAATGPVALTTSSFVTNGIVGGSFTVLVIYQGGQYTVYRRSFSNNQETLQRVLNAFVTSPQPATGQTISFVLNLNATLEDGSRLFRSPANTSALPNTLDFNFVTTNQISRDPNDNRLRTFDALYSRTGGRWVTLNIASTRSETNSTLSVFEPANDVITDDTTGQVNLTQLDITDFSIRVDRSS